MRLPTAGEMRLLLSAVCALVIVPAAGGFTIAGERWPGPTVSVWNETGYRTPVADAMKAWNAAGASIKLVPAAGPETADLVIGFGRSDDLGISTVGYSGSTGSTLLPRGLGRISATALAVHEIGHVLGLGHEKRGCTVMAPVVRAGLGSRCGLGACKVTWRCLVQADDARGLRKLYRPRAPA